MLPDNLPNLAERFTWARKNKGLSQIALARLLRVSQQSIEKVENERVRKPKYLPEAAKILEVPYEWLLSNTPPDASTLNALLDSAKVQFKDDPFVSPLLQSLEAAVKQRQKK